ncbi:MAG: ribose 5-phosphate isomerase B [Planctomycetota bacterium]
MRLAIASDHGGYSYKQSLLPYLKSKNYDVLDLGPTQADPVDYPDFAKKVAQQIADHQADYGILICKSGIGMVISANRFKGARAVQCYSPKASESSRLHNNANIACFGSEVQSLEEVKKNLDIFLNTSFAGDRHFRRVEKIDQI